MAVDNTLGVPNLADVELLGAGGFSVVYSATHTVFDRRVAVKVLTSVASDDDRRRFEQECRAMGRLSGNPNVVTVYQADYTATNRPYLIMELIEGGSLADLLARQGRLPWEQAVDLVLPLCGAIRHAHREGVLHRDIKPDNILLDNGAPKLTDFGIARLRDSGRGASTQISASWLHAPPETFDQTRDERSDLYALASTLYTAVGGHPPMWREGDDSVYPMIQRLMTEEGPPALPPGAGPPELSQFLQRALAREPNHRPQTAEEFTAELAAIRGVALPAASITAPPPGDTTRALGGYLFQPASPHGAPGDDEAARPRPPGPHGPTTSLPTADTGDPPGVGQAGTEVMDHRVRQAALAVTGTGAVPPPAQQRSPGTTAFVAAAVVLVAAVSVAIAWLAFDGTTQSAAPAAEEAGADGDPAAGDGASGTGDGGSDASGSVAETTTTTVPDDDGDGVPDAEDACPTEVGVSSGLGCPDADGDGVPDAEDACPIRAGEAADSGCPVSRITIDLVRFHVVGDCDGGLFGGDGEFVLQASASSNRAGVEEQLIAFEDSSTLPDGAEVAIGESATVTLAQQPGQELSVTFLSREEDGFPEPPLDGRLGPDGVGAATNSHQWVTPSGWSNLDPSGAYTLVNGAETEDCQVELDYLLTID
jgi:tRNA A-37 threonylcarbamoyl transferase component Bud32